MYFSKEWQPTKKITTTLQQGLAPWLRVKAAEDDRSVSKWLAELLERMRPQEDAYQTAMRRCLEVKPRKVDWLDGHKLTSKQLYDRPRLR